MTSASGNTYPARVAATAQLERFSDKARAMQLGQAGSERLWRESNRAVAHVGYAVSADRMAGRPAEPGEGTVWTIASGVDVLIVIWWMRLRPDSTAGEATFPLVICMEPQDYMGLDGGEIDEGMLAVAHELAAEFLRAAGL